MSTIISIGTAVPSFANDQMIIHKYMESIYDGTADEKKRLKLLYQRSGIGTRYSVIPDFNLKNNQQQLFTTTKNNQNLPSIENRLAIYEKNAAQLAIMAIDDAMKNTTCSLKEITHLITVTCTGMSAPSLDLEIVELLDLPHNIERTSINFMGCYAAVHALKQADAICNSRKNARVLIVCIELCTLHFQQANDHDNLTANAIFADGAAACIVQSEDEEKKDSLKIKSFYSEIHTKGKQDMAWQISSTGFLMTLSSYIPQLIKTNIDNLIKNAIQKFGIQYNEIHHWAIHPGGRKILDVIGSQLNIERSKLQHSYSVLNEYGNMSSPTILFVMQRILNDDTMHGNILGAAFGPGLTMETFLVNKN